MAACRGYSDNVKNVTISLDADSYRCARIEAAQEGRSLSAYIRELIVQKHAARRRREQLGEFFQLMDEKGAGLQAEEILPRDELYDERFDR